MSDAPPVSAPPVWPTASAPPPPTQRPSLGAMDLALLIGVLSLAAWLRFDRARADGLTFDEQWHMELSTGRGSPHLTLPTGQLIADAPPVTSLRGAPPIWAVWTHMAG